MQRARRTIFIWAAVALLAAGAFFGYFAIRNARAEAAFEGVVADLRAHGEPTTLAEMAPPPVPDEENAAVAFAEANAWLEDKDFPLLDAWLREPADWTEEEYEQVRARVEELASYYRKLEEAAARPKWRPAIDWSGNPLDMELAFLHGYSAAHEPLGYRVYAAPDSELAEALARGAGLVERLDRGPPFLIGYLVATVWRELPASWLRAVKHRRGLDAVRLRPLLDPILARMTPKRGPPTSAFVGERPFFIEVWRDWAAGESVPPIEDATLFNRAEGYRQGIATVRAVGAAVARSEVSAEEALAVAAEFSEQDPGWDGFGNIVVRVFRQHAKHVAVMRLARVALAVMAHEQEHGAWPESLAALAPMFPEGVPADPYTGGSFVYRSEGDGVWLAAAPPDEDDREELIFDQLAWRLE